MYCIASLLAALALAHPTKLMVARLGLGFVTFCDKMENNPLKFSGHNLVTRLVFRLEHFLSPNMLETDLKYIKYFKLSANKSIFYKNPEADSVFRVL